MVLNLKLTEMNRQIQKKLRHNQYLSDKQNYDIKACVIAGVLPTILEYFEDLREVFSFENWIETNFKND